MSAGARFGLAHLLHWLARGDTAMAAEAPGADRLPPFSTVTMDGRLDGWPPMLPRGLFLANRGEQRDGHDFVKQGLENGAAAALVSRVPENLRAQAGAGKLVVVAGRTGGPVDPLALAGRRTLVVVPDDPQRTIQQCAAWWRRQVETRVVAVTGSVGKTTTKDLLANVLDRRFRVLRTEGNLNNELGLPIMALRLTPMHEIAVLEVGISAVGEMKVFAGIAQPDVAVVTRVAPAHLHQLKTIDIVEREKGKLVEALPTGGVAVLNADDERVTRMAGRTRARSVRFGVSPAADVRAVQVQSLGFDGLRFELESELGRCQVTLPLVGRHFVTCALAAAAAALECGATLDDVVQGLEQPLEGRRLQPRRLASGVTILDDTYNASPEATKAALDVLAETGGRRIAVLGDMFELGDYSARGHSEVGGWTAGRVDLLIAVGEHAGVLIDAARQAGMPAEGTVACASNDEAAAYLAPRLRADDFVLVKGSRGMRMEAIVQALSGASTTVRVH
jgi:UDP-N-acetylmuramoyl-tripeptide--D-alanyl-D-alanine ligase